uniref:ARAD1C11682p n=1 Tax=Blastobotrys adeninivorans TaxID=409370 RepID=A0A060SZW0_BLAAD
MYSLMVLPRTSCPIYILSTPATTPGLVYAINARHGFRFKKWHHKGHARPAKSPFFRRSATVFAGLGGRFNSYRTYEPSRPQSRCAHGWTRGVHGQIRKMVCKWHQIDWLMGTFVRGLKVFRLFNEVDNGCKGPLCSPVRAKKCRELLL